MAGNLLVLIGEHVTELIHTKHPFPGHYTTPGRERKEEDMTQEQLTALRKAKEEYVLNCLDYIAIEIEAIKKGEYIGEVVSSGQMFLIKKLATRLLNMMEDTYL